MTDTAPAAPPMSVPAPNLRGVLVPIVTPFTETLAPDPTALGWLARGLLAEGAAGIVLFGTTGEANSLSLAERIALLDAVVEGGLPADRLLVGTGACAFPDVVALTRAAVWRGAAGVLMLPPFYYKAVSDDGLFAFYERVIAEVADPRLKIYLYHIPKVSGVPLSPGLVGRLATAFPGTVVGIKDSSGDPDNLHHLLAVAPPGFAVYAGTESLLLEGLRAGAAGCITASGNVNVAAISRIATLFADRADDPLADAVQAEAGRVRIALSAHPLIPALKTLVAAATGAPGWARVRPPLLPLDAATAATARADLAAAEGAGLSIDRIGAGWPGGVDGATVVG